MADLDFCYRAALPGVPGLSGDLASLSGIQFERLKQLNQFYKDWRQFIADAVCEPLTPVRRYRIYESDMLNELYAEMDGEDMIGDGVAVHLPEKTSARVYILKPVE